MLPCSTSEIGCGTGIVEVVVVVPAVVVEPGDVALVVVAVGIGQDAIKLATSTEPIPDALS